MIGKLIGGYAGSKLAKSAKGGVDGPMGAALGMVAVTVLRRMSLPAMLALGAGGFVMKKFIDGREAEAKLNDKR